MPPSSRVVLRTSWRILPGCSSVSGSSRSPCRRASVRSVESASPVPNGIVSRAPHSESRPNSVRNHGLPAARNASSPSRISRPPRSATLCATTRPSRGSGASTATSPHGDAPPGPNAGVPSASNVSLTRVRRARRDRGGPGDPAVVADRGGSRVERGREAAAVVVPGEPAVRGLAGDRVARAAPGVRRTSAPGPPRRSTCSASSTGCWPRQRDLHLLDQPVGGQRAAPVDGDGRVVQPAAEPAGDVGELLPVRAQHGGADPLEVAAVDGEHERRRAAARRRRTTRRHRRTHLAVGVGQQQGRSGDGDGEVVEGGHEVVGHGPTL